MNTNQDRKKQRKTTRRRYAPSKAPQSFEQEYFGGTTSDNDRTTGLMRESSGWDVYNNEAKKVDAELVKDWTTSLNFLLLFAAIFSAVLTPFIIESKKLLEQDSTKIIADVMIFYTNNLSNGTNKPYPTQTFDPTISGVTANCLLFASLSASLIAALASVVALQWVSDYDAAITRGGSSPAERAKRRQFRYAGVLQWKMSEIIAALPQLLYTSVILFFSGLILWMYSIHPIVGRVVASGSAIAVIFYITSTLIAVTYDSAPLRTPLSRWLYSLAYLPFSMMYTLAIRIRLSSISGWLEKQHLQYHTAYLREARAIANQEELASDALAWLAKRLSLSQDSYQRFLLLVGELPRLSPGHLPSFESVELSWYLIFDLLGWGYLIRNQEDLIEPYDLHGMTILQRCWAIPAVRRLIVPEASYEFDPCEPEHWSQFCNLSDNKSWDLGHESPNHLFLLLRDSPTLSDPSYQEVKLITRLCYWRNSDPKSSEIWKDIFTSGQSLSLALFYQCLSKFNAFAYYCASPVGKEGLDSIHISILCDIAQAFIGRLDIDSGTIAGLMRTYEVILEPFAILGDAPPDSYLFNPLKYGRVLQDRPPNEHNLHDSLTLLLSRLIQFSPMAEWRSQVKTVVAMLWIRPSNPTPRNWDNLIHMHGGYFPISELEAVADLNWIEQAYLSPTILETLHHLSNAQDADPDIGPLWRVAKPDTVNDPQFIEALETFDKLMGADIEPVFHTTMINLICNDLGLDQSPNFDNYFTASRLRSLSTLQDPCLHILAAAFMVP